MKRDSCDATAERRCQPVGKRPHDCSRGTCRFGSGCEIRPHRRAQERRQLGAHRSVDLADGDHVSGHRIRIPVDRDRAGEECAERIVRNMSGSQGNGVRGMMRLGCCTCVPRGMDCHPDRSGESCHGRMRMNRVRRRVEGAKGIVKKIARRCCSWVTKLALRYAHQRERDLSFALTFVLWLLLFHHH